MNKIIDLFAGCGGFSVGFEKAGFEISKAIEHDKNIAKTYEMNHKNVTLYVDDIAKVDNIEYFNNQEADIIIGGPPCQGFSMAGARIRSNFLDDPRNYLFKHYINIVKIVKPKAFILENVKGILTMNKGEIFREIIKAFSDKSNFNGDQYNLYYKVIKATEFGIPQKRERLILIGIKNQNINFDDIFQKTKKKIEKNINNFFDSVTVWDAISNLSPASETGEVVNNRPLTNYQKYLSSPKHTILNHSKPNHSKIAVDRMTRVKAGENWTILNEEIKSIHSGSYGRLEKDGVASTITTRFDTPSGGQFIHPVENRTLTPREAARIQSFPDDFVFYGTKSIICRQIGNAVPPKISYFFAEFIKEVIYENDN